MEKKPTPPGDKIYSTYWWEIELDHRHPRNFSPKVTTLTGYSKLQGHDEAKDKNTLLMKRVYMLAANGYLDANPNRVKYITIYKRSTVMINKNADPQILYLMPRDFEMKLTDTQLYPGLVKFLKDLYDYLKTGKDIRNLLPKDAEKFSKDQYFDITRYNFPSRMHLYTWAEKMIKDGHSFAQVQSFVYKYTQNKIFVQPQEKPVEKIQVMGQTLNITQQ